MEISWYGTASIKIQSKEHAILIDPFVPMSPSTVPVSISDYFGVEDILLTHGHFDHIRNVPKLCEDRHVQVYCTQTPCNTLQASGVSRRQLKLICSEQTLNLKDIKVRVYPGKHGRIDYGVMLNRERRKRVYMYPRELFKCLRLNRMHKENKETVCFEIESEGRRVFVLGSLGLDERVSYPTGMDMLILPYQGARQIFEIACQVVEKLKPKAILLDHFDDTFPPLTFHENTEKIKEHFAGKIPVFEIDYKHPISI